MSKRELFKGLLNDDIKDTGSSQKMRILNDHLLPGSEITKEEVKIDNKVENLTTTPVEEPEGVMSALPQTDQLSENDIRESEAAIVDEKKNSSLSVDSTFSSSTDIDKPNINEARITNPSSNTQFTDEKQSASASGINNILSTLANTNDLTVEETHTRRTYLIDNKLLKELDKISKGKKKGFATKVINSGLRIVLELMKENKHHL
ncbi:MULTISPECIES: hypothetical protein [unclassified Paenibacillus]|uniref:Uncharacterized protein n=1 Tax=Paenibacillus provencensis TaxID=441151 RepID=A0ABW3QC26_9BACL|nr:MULTISPECIES: hypothetical protein [unclassified Paenibacillus]MCM3131110.1 hypothetical protein [Paenibacillus sp. MER 78]SDX69846.1 hypothetical protein SAMN05518848_1122 [Paenibacillus sp. PDC88]SFS90120.1 hypothetical protein SAMN04488601_106210 [Paenibacillus sp. 453mf]